MKTILELAAGISGIMTVLHWIRVKRGEARKDDPPLWQLLFFVSATTLFFINYGDGGSAEGVSEPSEVGINGR